jgi:hypothetical protein
MTLPFDQPGADAPARNTAAEAWLAALEADIDATTSAEWQEIGRREERVRREIEAIEAGQHALCLAKTAT